MKVAVLVLAGTETHEGLGRLVNALMLAQELKGAGDEVRLVFDGAGTEGLAALADPSHKAHALFLATRDRIQGPAATAPRPSGSRRSWKA